jgi:hypothetical protein
MIINDVTPAAFDGLRKQLTITNKAQVTGTTSGAITGSGVVANYSYDAGQQTLTVEVTHHPFFTTSGEIETRLRTALANIAVPA